MFGELTQERMPNAEKLGSYGFIKQENVWRFKKTIMDGEFSLEIRVNDDGQIDTVVTEMATGEEYVLYKTNAPGVFVGKVRLVVEEAVEDVVSSCYDGEAVPEKKKNSYQKIYDVVMSIPEGKVATYGQVARLAGNSRWGRVVGYALHVNPMPGVIPCHRVVNAKGEPSAAFAFGGENRQIKLLENEGVRFVDGHVDMEQFRWKK